MQQCIWGHGGPDILDVSAFRGAVIQNALAFRNVSSLALLTNLSYLAVCSGRCLHISLCLTLIMGIVSTFFHNKVAISRVRGRKGGGSSASVGSGHYFYIMVYSFVLCHLHLFFWHIALYTFYLQGSLYQMEKCYFISWTTSQGKRDRSSL